MTVTGSCVYVGKVVHKRLHPRRHAFSYRVFALCLDVDEIDELSARLRLFSRGRWNLLSFHDSDYSAGCGRSVATRARTLLADAGHVDCGARILLVSYPRLLGYVFNPLSVYFCYRSDGRLGAVIYEVTNTLGERRSYVIAVEHESEIVTQRCAKELYVSPFTAPDASYGFHLVPPGERILLGVDLRQEGRPVLKTHFGGTHEPLTDRAIISLLLRYPLMTLKVVAAIHVQAARLWLKGVPLQAYRASPRYAFTAVRAPTRETKNV